VLGIPDDTLNGLRGSFEGRSCAVTGGAGFIGGHLCAALVSLGARVAVIDDLSNSTMDAIGPLLVGEDSASAGRLRFVRGSILDDDALSDAVEDASAVFHIAAMCSVPRSIEHPERAWAVNTTGTLRTLLAARAAGARRVIYSASSSAYGNTPGLPKSESETPAPISPYGASKLAGEHLCAAFAESYGLSTVSLRYFNVFGPRQRADSPYAGVIPSFAARILAGEGPRIFGDGMQSRDFTFVGNVVLANLLAASSERGLAGEVYNIAAGSRLTVQELAERMIAHLADGPLEPEHAPQRPGDVLHSQADISRAERELGYGPVVPFEEGLERTVGWYREAMADAAAEEIDGGDER